MYFWAVVHLSPFQLLYSSGSLQAPCSIIQLNWNNTNYLFISAFHAGYEDWVMCESSNCVLSQFPSTGETWNQPYSTFIPKTLFNKGLYSPVLQNTALVSWLCGIYCLNQSKSWWFLWPHEISSIANGHGFLHSLCERAVWSRSIPSLGFLRESPEIPTTLERDSSSSIWRWEHLQILQAGSWETGAGQRDATAIPLG